MNARTAFLLLAVLCVLPAPALAVNVTIDVLEPMEGGKVVFETIAPPKIGGKAQGRISILMRIKNGGQAAVKITKVEILGKKVSDFANPKDVPPGSSFDFQSCRCDESLPLIIDQPFPPTAKIAVYLENVALPVAQVVSLVPHTNDGGPLLYPGKANDLRRNETWGASSNHPSGHQVFALDMGVVGWDGSAWSAQFPGKAGSPEKESYRVYGMPVYAMADGTVCWVLNDHQEHPTTTSNAPTISPSKGKYFPGGNQIYLRNGDETALYAHLQPGSIPQELLQVGAAVKKGQYLGKAGFSGATSAPHLHIHVKNVSSSPCDEGVFRPMTFKNLQSMTRSEATSLAAIDKLAGWMSLTNHSAPDPYGLLYPSTAAYTFCKGCTDDQQYIGVWRAGSEINLLVKAEGWDQFTQKWSELSNDHFRLIEIDTFLENGKRQFLGSFERGSGKYYLWNVAGWDTFTAKWQEASQNGTRLIDLATYMDGGSRRYVGVFRAGNDPYVLWSITGWDNFTKKWDELGKSNLRLIDLETFPVGNNQRQYIGVFRQGNDPYALWSITGWSSFTDKWKQFSQQGLRLIDIETFAVGSQRQFIGVFRQGGGGYALESVTGYHRLLQSNEKYSAQGLRLVDLHVEE